MSEARVCDSVFNRPLNEAKGVSLGFAKGLALLSISVQRCTATAEERIKNQIWNTAQGEHGGKRRQSSRTETLKLMGRTDSRGKLGK